MTTATARQDTKEECATLLYARFRLNGDGARRYLFDPANGHMVAVSCAGAPGLDQPVRWALRDGELVIRTTSKLQSKVPRELGDLLHGPRTELVKLHTGDHVAVKLLAAPTRTVPNGYRQLLGEDNKRERRGAVVPIVNDEEIYQWLETRLSQAFVVDTLSFRKRLVRSRQLWHKWFAVDVNATAIVTSPKEAAQLLVGRSKAYGFGLPVISQL
jgi:hypothetical protein